MKRYMTHVWNRWPIGVGLLLAGVIAMTVAASRPVFAEANEPAVGSAALVQVRGGAPLGTWRGQFSTGDVLTFSLFGNSFYLDIPPQMPVTGNWSYNATSPVGGIVTLGYYSAGRPQQLYYSIGWIDDNTIMFGDPSFSMTLRRQN